MTEKVSLHHPGITKKQASFRDLAGKLEVLAGHVDHRIQNFQKKPPGFEHVNVFRSHQRMRVIASSYTLTSRDSGE